MVVSPVAANVVPVFAQVTPPVVPQIFDIGTTNAIAGTTSAASAAVDALASQNTLAGPQAATAQPSVQQRLLAALEQAFFADMVDQFQQSGLFTTDPALSGMLTGTFPLDALLGSGSLAGGQTAANTGPQALGTDLAVLLASIAPQSIAGSLLDILA